MATKERRAIWEVAHDLIKRQDETNPMNGEDEMFPDALTTLLSFSLPNDRRGLLYAWQAIDNYLAPIQEWDDLHWELASIMDDAFGAFPMSNGEGWGYA